MQAELDQVCGDSLPTLMHRQWSVLHTALITTANKCNVKYSIWFSLPYTEAVLMEAQRCSTIAPFTVPHLAMRDTQLQGYTIPKVCVVTKVIMNHIPITLY